MQVKACTEIKKPTAPQLVTYNQMTSKEGVYIPYYSKNAKCMYTELDRTRLIVIHSSASDPSILYYNDSAGEKSLTRAVIGWGSGEYLFERTNESVCFDICKE